MKLVVSAFIGLTAFCALTHAQQGGSGTDADWQAISSRDLAFIRKTIQETHPGIIDESNTSFHDWFDKGYAEALSLVPRVNTQADALAVLRFYTVGFKDGHLGVQGAAQTARNEWAGWIMNRKSGDYVVSYRADSWGIAIPPLGAKVISCDGRVVNDIIEQDIAPFVDRRLNLENSVTINARLVTVLHGLYPTLGRSRPSSCLLEIPGQPAREYRLAWRDMTPEDMYNGFSHQAPMQGLRQVRPNKYWLNIPTFSPSGVEYQAMESLLARLRNIRNAELVVVDLRGNTGGNGLLGAAFFSALIGHAPSSPEPSPYALWRVSAQAISTLEDRLKSVAEQYGTDNETYRWLGGMKKTLMDARSKGESWAIQPSSSLDDASPGTVQAFKGRLVLVTQADCASACLDIASAIKRSTDVTHMGRATSADSVYNDIAILKTPSGLGFWIPMKVWRHRALANNQPLIPKYVFEGDMGDTKALEAWLFDTLN